MKATAETATQEKTVQQLVIDYQQYAKETKEHDYAIVDVIEALDTFKVARVAYLRKALPHAIGKNDLIAVFDSATYEAANTFTLNSGVSFYHYLNGVLRSNVHTIIKRMSQQNIRVIFKFTAKLKTALSQTGNFTDEQLDNLANIVQSKLVYRNTQSAQMVMQLVLQRIQQESEYSYQQLIDLFNAAENIIDEQYYTEMKAGGAL